MMVGLVSNVFFSLAEKQILLVFLVNRWQNNKGSFPKT